MIQLTQELVYETLRRTNSLRGGYEQLTLLALQTQPVTAEWEHFLAWFQYEFKEEVSKTYPDVAQSVLLNLYREQFDQHVVAGLCNMEWLEMQIFPPYENVFLGRFKCMSHTTF